MCQLGEGKDASSTAASCVWNRLQGGCAISVQIEGEGAGKNKNRTNKQKALVPVLKSVIFFIIILENFVSFSFTDECVTEGCQT